MAANDEDIDTRALDALAGTVTIPYANGTITSSFGHTAAVNPYEAVAELAAIITAAGGNLEEPFTPEEQDNKGEPDMFVTAEIRVTLPSGARVWIELECPTDRNFA